METKDLTLVVKEKNIGSLVTNAKEIRDYVVNRIAEYNPDNYAGTPEQAKKDKAELNKAADLLNSERIKLEKEFNKPFEEFKNIVTDTCKLIKDASSKIDLVVKAADEKIKAEKREQIESYWKDVNFNLISLDKIFNPKWLNKTFKLLDVQEEINDRVTQIKNDLKAIEDFGSDVQQLKEIYLSTLNLQMTLSKGAELKANREKLAAMEAEKKEVQEEPKEEKTPPVVNVDFGTKEVVSVVVVEKKQEEVKVVSNEPLYEFEVVTDEAFLENIAEIVKEHGMSLKVAIKATGTQSQLLAFKSELEENGITYNKVIKDKVLTLEIK